MGNSYAGDTDHLSLLAGESAGETTTIYELNEQLLDTSGFARPFYVPVAQSGGCRA